MSSGTQSITTVLYPGQLSNDLGPHSPPINGRRVLSIELEPRAQANFDYPPHQDLETRVLAIEQKIIENIKEIVAEDIRAVPSERIDSVVFGPTRLFQPRKEICQALVGLLPNHLTIYAGWEETANVRDFDVLQHQWTDLQSLYLQDICDDVELPALFSQISSLTLNCCCGLEFIPPGGATRLKHLRIRENDAFRMFRMAFDGNPDLATSLEVLDVESMNGHDRLSASELEDSLKRCMKLRELRLAVGYHNGLDATLASCIPSSVEKLDLKFSRSLPFLQSFDDRIDRAKDSSWLPLLASFQMSIDAKSKVAESSEYCPFSSDVSKEPTFQLSVESFDLAFETKRKALYDVLRYTRPQIELIS
ncbi:hypothetical protein BDZ97DRAFT_2076398 [Flammula alnicola]|nr:hypothetical protein BDZ97DRAFT_2076398 [Flammula alnicola]